MSYLLEQRYKIELLQKIIQKIKPQNKNALLNIVLQFKKKIKHYYYFKNYSH
ncbi:MAG: hypothetical protein WJU30_00238 [Candidatus Phytoplasma pruni]